MTSRSSEVSLHIQALKAMVEVPHSLTVPEAKTFMSADKAFNEGRWQDCLDLLATIKKEG
jgi:hypothetical protein